MGMTREDSEEESALGPETWCQVCVCTPGIAEQTTDTAVLEKKKLKAQKHKEQTEI